MFIVALKTLLGFSFIGSCVFGFYYINEPEDAQNILFNVSWEVVNYYHYYKDQMIQGCLYLENKIKQQTGESENNQEINNTDITDITEIIGYQLTNDICFKTKNIENNFLKKNKFDIMFIRTLNNENNENYLYKRILNKNELEKFNDLKDIKIDKNEDVIEKIFLQIEFQHEDGTTFELQKHMIGFYINKNKILDYMFLKWFLRTFCTYELNDTKYKIRLINKNVNMEYIKHDSYILLDKENQNKYIIQNDTTENK